MYEYYAARPCPFRGQVMLMTLRGHYKHLLFPVLLNVFLQSGEGIEEEIEDEIEEGIEEEIEEGIEEAIEKKGETTKEKVEATEDLGGEPEVAIRRQEPRSLF